MSSVLRYGYNLPWRGAVIGAVFYAALSFFAAVAAAKVSGAFSFCLNLLAVAFALLALFMIVRRIIFPRTLELTDDAILYPHGFPRTRIRRIAFEDIIRMRNGTLPDHPSFCLETSRGHFEIGAARFSNFQNYNSAKDFVCSKAAISLADDGTAEDSGILTRVRKVRWFPEPILQWSEPEEYIRYRTHLAVSKPLSLRLARTSRFFVYCFGFFFVPWLGLKYFFPADSPAVQFLPVLIPATLFFAWLHWLNASNPARRGHISICKNGIHELSGLQTRGLNYSDCIGWTVVERDFEGQVFQILLLKRPKYIYEVALPDVETRDRLIEIFNDKNIPKISDQKPSWETE